MSTKLGELLVKEGLISPEQLEEALAHQKEHGEKLGFNLVKLGFITDETLTQLLSRQFHVPSIELSRFEVDPAACMLVPPETAHKYKVLPLSKVHKTLTLAMVDPSDLSAIDDLRFMTGCQVVPVLAPEAAIMEALQKYSDTYCKLTGPFIKAELDKLVESQSAEDVEVLEEGENIDLEELERSTEDAPIVKLCNLILTDAHRRSANEIHIEPFQRQYRIRFRIDGRLYVVMTPPMRLRDAITNRLKLMARLDIAEKHPQRGEFRIRMRGGGKAQELDFALSTMLTRYGEKIFLRVLDRRRGRWNLNELGFDPESRGVFERAIEGSGLVLVVGPSRAGKTRTLHSALRRVADDHVNIVAFEDPIEYDLDGVNHVRVEPSSVPAAIKFVLPENPQVLLVGEISNSETAEAALRAALGDRLVLSSLIATDTATGYQSLLSYHTNTHLIAASLRCVCAQRLVRRICPSCISGVDVPREELLLAGFPNGDTSQIDLRRGRGCGDCYNGYRGQIGVFEVLEINDEIRDAMVRGISIQQIRRLALEHGMISLRESGLRKIRAGLTTVEEVLRETPQWLRPNIESIPPYEPQGAWGSGISL